MTDRAAVDPPMLGSDDEPEMVCPITGSYCTGNFCGDYGCAKSHGFYDGEGDDDGIF